MSSPGRAVNSPVRGHRRAPARSSGSRPRRSGTPDLAARLLSREPILRRRIRHRDTLLTIFRSVSATVEPTEIAALAITHAASWIPAPAWAIVSSDATGQMSVLAERNVVPAMAPVLPLVAGWTMESGKAFMTGNLLIDGRIEADFGGSIVAFPLVCRGRTAAAILGLDARASLRAPRLPPATRAAIAVLLEPIAAALDTALLLKNAEALSVTDDLTRLYNSRYLNQVLRRETKRAARSGGPLSLLFVDLDGFKLINDTYGHLSGSRALVEAGAVIRGCARETDVVARFGGDEFALILPETGAAGARAVAERVRERIAAWRFLGDAGLAIALTASVGIATLPAAASSADALVQAADSAMYQVKARGKNGIQAAPVAADK